MTNNNFKLKGLSVSLLQHKDRFIKTKRLIYEHSEHQAKEILREYGAPVSNGVVILSLNEIKEKYQN